LGNVVSIVKTVFCFSLPVNWVTVGLMYSYIYDETVIQDVVYYLGQEMSRVFDAFFAKIEKFARYNDSRRSDNEFMLFW
jgi:hypothetical protein